MTIHRYDPLDVDTPLEQAQIIDLQDNVISNVFNRTAC